MNVFGGGESPGLTDDYKSQGEKILGRVSLATWKGSRDNMGEFSPGALGWEEKADNVFIRNSLACIMHRVYKQKWCVIGPRNGVPRDMRTPISHCPHFFPSPKFWLKVEFGVT